MLLISQATGDDAARPRTMLADSSPEVPFVVDFFCRNPKFSDHLHVNSICDCYDGWKEGEGDLPPPLPARVKCYTFEVTGVLPAHCHGEIVMTHHDDGSYYVPTERTFCVGCINHEVKRVGQICKRKWSIDVEDDEPDSEFCQGEEKPPRKHIWMATTEVDKDKDNLEKLTCSRCFYKKIRDLPKDSEGDEEQTHPVGIKVPSVSEEDEEELPLSVAEQPLAKQPRKNDELRCKACHIQKASGDFFKLLNPVTMEICENWECAVCDAIPTCIVCLRAAMDSDDTDANDIEALKTFYCKTHFKKRISEMVKGKKKKEKKIKKKKEPVVATRRRVATMRCAPKGKVEVVPSPFQPYAVVHAPKMAPCFRHAASITCKEYQAIVAQADEGDELAKTERHLHANCMEVVKQIEKQPVSTIDLTLEV